MRSAVTARRMLVLPEPDGPIRLVNWPGLTSRSMSSRIGWRPNATVRPRTGASLDDRHIQQSVQVHRSRLEKVGDLLGPHDPLNGVEVDLTFGIERKAVALDDLFELRDVASGE